jgi:predicted RecB family nuclease
MLKRSRNNELILTRYTNYALFEKLIFIKNSNTYIPATSCRNYLLHDPILDWFNIHGKTRFNNFHKNNLNNVLFSFGHQFETNIMDELRNKFPNQIKSVINNQTENVNYRDYTQMNITKKLMMEGVPIIEQAMLYNPFNKTFGIADLLVRSDYINKIFSNPVLSNEEINVSCLFNKKYHYRVVDIKWSNLCLTANGINIRNVDNFPAYKGQLLIYNTSLGLLQGYFPQQAYILGKSYKYEAKNTIYESNNYFERAGVIDYASCDANYVELTRNAINWYNDVLQYGASWDLYKPHRFEMYPNMSNTSDAPWTELKQSIADKIFELTSIWMVGHRNRQIGFTNNILSFDSNSCTADKLGIRGNIIAPIVDKIIDANRPSTEHKYDIVNPHKIKNNENNWKTINQNDLYLDFETISDMWCDTKLDMNNKYIHNWIFMIGVGQFVNDQWIYKCFKLKNLTIEDEDKMMSDFINYVGAITKTPRFFHWSHAEESIFEYVNNRHQNKFYNFIRSITFIDMLKIFKSEPIIIKGAVNFKLKQIGKAMYKHGLIESTWNNINNENGLTAMIGASQYYKNSNNRDDTILDAIEKYNETDCKVLYEITNYFRNK